MPLLLLSLAWIACDDDLLRTDEHAKNSTEYLIGNWINPQYTDTIITYQKADTLKNQDYGFSFRLADQFTERKNSGWCGTPPITYSDFEGTWIQHDSILDIQVAYWGGMADYKWKILSLDNKKLTITVLETEYHFEGE
jgi:hypothetical protein